jgi:murein L,D-transpeptidase YcbB/YkuD
LVAPIVLLMAAVTAGGCVSRRPPAPDAVTETALARRIAAALAAPQPSGLDGESIDVAALRRMYAERRHTPLWIDESGATDARAEGVLAVLAGAAREGLDPRDYHADAIRRRLATAGGDDAVALELLLSDGVVRYAVHQASGVRPPAARDPDAALEHGDPDAGTVVREVAGAPDPGARLRAFAPAHEPYRRLRDALALHRGIAVQGGWPLVPETVLRPGMTDPAVPILKERLAMSGDLEEGANPPRRYDDDLVVALRRFQWRHGIGPDGVVGKGTIAALNVPVGPRIEEIIANMERWRWFGAELPERWVKVNVPDYSLALVENGTTVLTMPVVVGKTDWRTPVLSSQIRRSVFNPSWSVPPSIAKEEILPKTRADAGYLERQGIVTRGDGRLRQAPGPRNPLGRVKFEMPNPHGIYLHDTPSRGAFARSRRALSHGCVRLKDPLLLADAVLAGTNGWDDERRGKVLATWRTQSIALATPVAVYVQYETAWVDELGAVQFRDDVYERDPVLRRQMADAGRAELDARSRGRRLPERGSAGP